MSDGDTAYMEALKGGDVYTSLEVTKNTKGYNWSVKIASFGNLEKIKEQLVETEAFLKAQYEATTKEK